MSDLKKILNEQLEALTEDLGDGKEEPFSEAWVIDKVLHNQYNALLNLVEDVGTTSDIVAFTTFSLPLVRKIFSNLIAMKLVSVQPMTQPTGKIFYLDFVYGNDGSSVSKGDSIYDNRERTYSTATEQGSVKELQFKMTSTDITAIEKKLKARWTIEMQQDLKAYHGLSLDSELLIILQQQIINEIDGLILYDLLSNASAGNVNWNPTDWLAGDTSTLDRYWYRRTLYEAIVDADNMIYKKRYRYATWIVGHPDAIVRLEKLEDFKYTSGGAARGAADTGVIGRHVVGTLAGRYTVYKDPFWPDSTKLLLGYKGATWSDTIGYYAPYIPLYTTPLIVDPNDFTPRRGLMSRFAYGTLISDGLATVTITSS